MSIFRTAAYTYLFTMLALLFAPLVSRAQALPSTGFPYTTTGNTHVFTGGTTTAANAGTFTFGNPANGPVYGTATQSLPIGGGYTATVQPKTTPAPANVAKALKNFAGKIVAPLAIGVAIYDLAKELGFGLDNSSGTVVVTKPDPNVCSVAPCYNYLLNLASAGVTGYHSTVGGAAQAALPLLSAKYGGTWSVTSITATYVYVSSAQYTNWSYGISKTSVAPSAPVSLPSSLTEFESAIAAKSGWPSGSHIGRALGEAVATGEPLPLPAPSSVTGPASVPGVPSITNFPDGSKTTVTPEKAISYGPGSVTVTDKTTTTQTSPSGVTTPVQDSTAPAPLPAPAPAQEIDIETCGLPGKPMCAVDGAGAPTGETLDQDQGKRTLDPITDFLANPSSIIPDLPNINWAFALPASCAVIPITGALSDYMPSIDVCQFQPMFHEIMSMVWMLGGLFGAISLFMRSSLSD